MSHPFPQESVEIYAKAAAAWRQEWPTHYDDAGIKKERLLSNVRGTMISYQKMAYGFISSLRTGNYAHWPHELNKEHLTEDNCTTIIPNLYLHLEALGARPQIVQFINFRRVRGPEDKRKPVYESHFAIIADAGKQKKYLVDPFWRTFGRILKQNQHSLRIGGECRWQAETRQFESLLYYTPEDFAAMMNRLKEPAESLDMLVAGQKVYQNKTIQKSPAGLMVYYDDSADVLTTRLYLPQIGFPSRAIYCSLNLSEEGNIESTALKLVVAKDDHWKSLAEEKTIAVTDLPTLRALRRGLSKVTRRHYRLGPELQKRKNKKTAESLLGLVETLWNALSPEEQSTLRPQVLGRTGYEMASPRQQYLFSQKERDQQLKEVVQHYWREKDNDAALHRKTWFHQNRIERMNQNKVRQIKRKQKTLQKSIEKPDEESTVLMNFRWRNKPGYDRNRDKWLYNQSRGKSTREESEEELEKLLPRQNLNPLIGYLAMIAEYLPVIFDQESHLELKFCRESIKEKVAARRAKRKQLALAIAA